MSSSDFPDLFGVFGPTSSSGQRRARWQTPEGRQALREAVEIARTGGPWQDALATLPHAEETFDPALGQRDLRNAPLDGLDLHGADLHGAILHEASARGTDLTGADLRGTGFDDADFTGADLSGADLGEASGQATFRDAQLDGARLVDAVLVGGDLRGASLVRADLTGANLHGADLAGADLTGAITVGASFGAFAGDEDENKAEDEDEKPGHERSGDEKPRADGGRPLLPPLHGSIGTTSSSGQRRARWQTPEGRQALREAVEIARTGGPWQDALATLPHAEETFDPALGRRDLRNAPLDGLDLHGADLHGAILHEASARGTDLTGADLRRAKVIDADFTGADLTDADLSGVRGRIDLRDARLDRARLVGAALQGCDFRDASLTGTDFTGASLLDCRFPPGALAGAVTVDTFFGFGRAEPIGRAEREDPA
ncbi:uncharacterized protein YjbI with pentapeptide repeats [Kitasatospora herbaricolor]|uniref:pentapeptide repeat-containing protein n=1 Tax=Kitasatospora herbaricolor TaxID=68217 RepID=UPI00278D3A9E|nr:pentapeptide repeat-containing protein [Kitasatospora herbaricolor]MDQ0310782.1 uncharacterized protein YjbI with pentapeptide repeats [Kitasatospora herbaricolor]